MAMLISLCASALGIRRINEVLIIELAVDAGERVSETVRRIDLGLATALAVALRVAPATATMVTATTVLTATVATAATCLMRDHDRELGIMCIKR